ncbi:hypothetical protein RND81_01G102700 [Saponaria officinalis]|uniref:PIPK domain-containing protein n=1 Tax=Saponaria officinalis TaxID=3572 RepID=A0AAW1N9B9_SAPOF
MSCFATMRYEMEAKCVVLLWLSILVLVPFDISSVDTSITQANNLKGDEPPPLVLRILFFWKDYLSSAGPMRTISGLLLSKLLTRPDMSSAFTRQVEWDCEFLEAARIMDYSLLVGVHFRDNSTGDKMGLSPFVLRVSLDEFLSSCLRIWWCAVKILSYCV